MRARTEETVPAQATPEQNGTSSELKTKSKTSKSPASQEVKMTPYLNTFATQFNLITAEIDSIYNPLTEYGKKTDAHDNFIHKTLNALHLRTPHTFISGNLTVEKAMKNNKYRKMIDCFLDERYPQYGLDTSTIERSPEFIIRSIRLLLLNIEHFVTEPVSKKKHLEIVQHVCFYVLAQECIWAADASFWQVFFSQDTELYHQFNELLENLIQMLKEDINELKDSSEANKLPQALNGLKKIAEELLILFPMTLLQHLLDRPIPESFLTHMDMTSLFKNESLSFYEFKKIKLPKNFNAVLIDPSKPDCPDLFNLVKHAFFAPTRKRLRQELEQTAVKEALAYTQNLSQNTRAPSGLLSQQPEESKALMYASREEPSYSNLSFHPSVNTLSSETKELSDRYHHNVNQYAQESLIAAVLPIALRNIYNNPDAYNPTLVNHLLSYIKNISKGIYLIEELIHLIENLKDSIKFHPHGGNMVSKPALPLANVRGSAITAFLNLLQIGVALQTQSRELRKAVITLRANIPFSQNAYQALVNAHDMSVKIHTEGLAHLKDMSDSLTIESICDDSLDAIRTYASMVVRQKALQRMCVNTDPFTYFLAPLAASTMTQARNHRQEHQKREGRYSRLQGQLLQLRSESDLLLEDDMEEDNDSPRITLLETLSLHDIQNAQLPKYRGLTLKKLLEGRIEENQNELYLHLDKGSFLLTAEAKNWLSAQQSAANREGVEAREAAAQSFQTPATATAHRPRSLHEASPLSRPSPSEEIRTSEAARVSILPDEAKEDDSHLSKLSELKEALDTQITTISELLPRLNRHRWPLNLTQWWVPLTVIGFPFYFAAKCYCYFYQDAIQQDLEKYRQYSDKKARARDKIEQVDQETLAYTRLLRERAREKTAREQQQQQAERESKDKDEQPVMNSAHNLFQSTHRSRVFSSNSLQTVNLYSEDEEQEKALTPQEKEACVKALLLRLDEKKIQQQLLACEISQLIELFDPLLPLAYQKILPGKYKPLRITIYNAVIDRFMVPDERSQAQANRSQSQANHERFQSHANKLMETYKTELIKSDAQFLEARIQAAIEATFPSIKNERIKQYISCLIRKQLFTQQANLHQAETPKTASLGARNKKK